MFGSGREDWQVELGDFTAACVRESARFYDCVLLLLREMVGC